MLIAAALVVFATCAVVAMVPAGAGLPALRAIRYGLDKRWLMAK